jgi:Zn-finger nucleic acid-binding protein
MRRRFVNREEHEKTETRVELKYCEHCGGLWLRECGCGEIYCLNCRPQVAQLPAPSRHPIRPRLPIGRNAVLGEDYDFDDGLDYEDDLRENINDDGSDDEDDVRAMGGAA